MQIKIWGETTTFRMALIGAERHFAENTVNPI